MARILFLAHRIPYPPTKGDKIRSWHFLSRMIAAGHEVHLGFFVDDPADKPHVDFLRGKVSSLEWEYMTPFKQKLHALSAFMRGTSMTEAAYPSARLKNYTARLLDSGDIDVIYVFSAAPFGWLAKRDTLPPILTDLVDVDSQKWQAYSTSAHWPFSLVYRREAHKLLAFEQRVAANSKQCFFVSDAEAALFNTLAARGVDTAHITGLVNGVDTAVFDPALYPVRGQGGVAPRLIFTGAMDYAPNVEAVCWFAKHVFPLVKKQITNIEFVIAGRPVAAKVQALNDIEGITVLGGVEDMAREIAGADIVLAPLRTARGIQNKVLEGMAMAKPVIASPMANEGIGASEDALCIAESSEDYLAHIMKLLDNPTLRQNMGEKARSYVQANFSWDASFHILNQALLSAVAIQKESAQRKSVRNGQA